MKKKVFALLLIGMVFCSQTYCWFSGNELIKSWRDYQSNSTTYLTGVYMGYIVCCLDSIDMINLAMSEGNVGARNLGIELPTNATVGQICSVVGKWLAGC